MITGFEASRFQQTKDLAQTSNEVKVKHSSSPQLEYSMSTQTWNASRYAANAAFVPALGQPVLDLLQARPGERILDLGCGDGVLTQKLAASGAEVVGVDSSADMVAAARQRGLDARAMDATKLTFDQEFDAVFSNAVLHWIKHDPDAAIVSVYRALRHPGRFVGEMGGHGCVAAVNLALVVGLEKRGIRNAASVCPWYFPRWMITPLVWSVRDLSQRASNLSRVPPRCRRECAAGWRLSPTHFVQLYLTIKEEIIWRKLQRCCDLCSATRRAAGPLTTFACAS